MLSYIVFVCFQRVLCLSRIYAWAEKADFGCLSSSLVRAGTSARLLNTQRSHRHHTDVQGLFWSFPAQQIPCVWQRASGHVRMLVHPEYVTQCTSKLRSEAHPGCWGLIFPVCCLHAYFFSPGKSWRTTKPLVTRVLISIAFCFPVIAIA